MRSEALGQDSDKHRDQDGAQDNSILNPKSYILDLRGVECPMNFVKTKIQLEKMQLGQTLEVLLDPGEAIESVPPSVLEEGHKITRQVEEDGYFKLFIQKC